MFLFMFFGLCPPWPVPLPFANKQNGVDFQYSPATAEGCCPWLQWWGPLGSARMMTNFVFHFLCQFYLFLQIIVFFTNCFRKFSENCFGNIFQNLFIFFGNPLGYHLRNMFANSFGIHKENQKEMCSKII